MINTTSGPQLQGLRQKLLLDNETGGVAMQFRFNSTSGQVYRVWSVTNLCGSSRGTELYCTTSANTQCTFELPTGDELMKFMWVTVESIATNGF